ncbi:hypothetical protein GQX74_007229 [Glossina fuscipes]|nr:hypothetical protein GQX74_007229 [Glossina fuscipes]
MVVTKREQVKQIIEMMKRYFPETIEDQKMYGVRIYYEELIRVLKIFTICLSVSCALYCVDPYVTLLVDHLKGRPVSFEYQLPFPLWYPFAVNNPFSSVDIVNEIFSFSLLINFFAAGALLCLAAVNVIAGSSFYDYIRHTTFLLVALADMYYVCKHADNLMTLLLTSSYQFFTLIKARFDEE